MGGRSGRTTRAAEPPGRAVRADSAEGVASADRAVSADGADVRGAAATDRADSQRRFRE